MAGLHGFEILIPPTFGIATISPGGSLTKFYPLPGRRRTIERVSLVEESTIANPHGQPSDRPGSHRTNGVAAVTRSIADHDGQGLAEMFPTF